MSAEVITTICSALGLLITLAGGFAWVLHRIDKVDERLSARIDGVEDRLNNRIDGLHGELTEVKIAVARLEGPGPRLTLPR